MITQKLIERVEGEAVVDFELQEGRVAFPTIRFPHMRGMEKILLGRPAMDALVITPRVCGICGHSHLMATVDALESAYRNAGVKLDVSPKALDIREITLMLELIQNHLKWSYLVIRPQLAGLLGIEPDSSEALKGAYAASIANKASALFSGQWPHSSYALPGGVTCDPTHVDVLQAVAALDDLVRFFENEFAGVTLDTFLAMKSCKEFNGIRSDMADTERMLIQAKMHEKGFGFDRFMVLGEHAYAEPSKILKTTIRKVEPPLADVSRPKLAPGSTEALNAHYKNAYYEAGPLARAMAMNDLLIKNMHRRFKDSAYTRVMARMYEIGKLLFLVKANLKRLDLSQPSFIRPPLPIQELHGSGEGVVEAPRGPLIHRIRIEAGTITDYRMITPTQWNLGCGTKTDPGVAQQAMIGSVSIAEAEFIFRTFDVCSVCTTH